MSFAAALNQTANKYNKEKNEVIQKVSTQIVDYIKKSCTNTANKGLKSQTFFYTKCDKGYTFKSEFDNNELFIESYEKITEMIKAEELTIIFPPNGRSLATIPFEISWNKDQQKS